MQFNSLCRVVEEKVFCNLARRHSVANTFRSLAAKAILTLVSVVAFCCVAPLSRGAGPTNDFCAGAEVIPGTAGALGPYYTSVKDIFLTTTNGDPQVPTCQEYVLRSVWYSFTPNTTAIYTLSACADAPAQTTVDDTVMAIYTSAGGCGGPFTELDCSDDVCGPGSYHSAITRQLDANITYYIVVWQYLPEGPLPDGGTVQLRVTRAMRPSNDTCATARQVLLDFPVAGSTSGGSDDYQLPPDSTGFGGVGQQPSTAPGRDVVYWFEAKTAGEYNFRVYNYNQNNLVVYVAGSCPSSGTPAMVLNCLGAANRSSASSAEEVVCVSLAANQRVFIFVDENEFTTGSSFMFEINRCYREREPNNAWTNATYIACGITGKIQPSSEVDFYFLGNPPPGSRAFLLVNGEAANATDFDLRLTTATETLEYDDSDNDSAFGQLSPSVAGTIMPGSAVYVRVNFRSFVPTEPYHLYAAIQPPLSDATPEIEPNGTPAEATFAARSYFQGVLAGPAPSTDSDMFGFTAQASELLLIGLDGDPQRNNTPINAKIELLDEFGNILVTVDDANGSSVTNSGAGTLNAEFPRSPGESLVYRVASDGTYFVRVAISPNATLPASTGDYLLSISQTCYVAAPRFRLWTRMLDGQVTLRLEGTPAARYRIEYSSDLRNWMSSPTLTTDSYGVVQYIDTSAAGAPQRFYRAVAP